DWDAFAAHSRFCVALARAELHAGSAEAAWKALKPALRQAMDDSEPAGLMLCGAAALRELAGASWPPGAIEDELTYLRSCAARLSGPQSDAHAPVDHGNVARRDQLSDRELQVIELVARGQSNKLIARALDISPHTVKRHMARIFDKTGHS